MVGGGLQIRVGFGGPGSDPEELGADQAGHLDGYAADLSGAYVVDPDIGQVTWFQALAVRRGEVDLEVPFSASTEEASF